MIRKLDIGRLSAAWIDGGREGCGERLLGVRDNSTLTFGQTHDPADTNPYFVSLISTETDGFAVSMQSSISSRQLVMVWWGVQATLERSNNGYYSVSGTLKNDTFLDKNSFSGNPISTDADRCGATKRSFIWKPEVNTSTFSGTISATEAVFSIEGSILYENTKRLVSYVIEFDGGWDSRSAKLSLDKPNPTWPKPGNPDAAGERSQVSSILVDTNPEPTVESIDAANNPENGTDDPTKDIEKIGVGGIAGIVSAVIFVLGLTILAAFCVIQRRKRQRDGKVYPEIAYIYASSPGPPTYPSEECQMREVLASNHSLPVTNQYQWRDSYESGSSH